MLPRLPTSLFLYLTPPAWAFLCSVRRIQADFDSGSLCCCVTAGQSQTLGWSVAWLPYSLSSDLKNWFLYAPVLLGNSQVIVDDVCWCPIQQRGLSAAPCSAIQPALPVLPLPNEGLLCLKSFRNVQANFRYV